MTFHPSPSAPNSYLVSGSRMEGLFSAPKPAFLTACGYFLASVKNHPAVWLSVLMPVGSTWSEARSEALETT